MPSLEMNLLSQWQEICSQETGDSTLSCGENPESLSHLGWVWYRVVTDGQTDRIKIVRALHYVLPRVKSKCLDSC